MNKLKELVNRTNEVIVDALIKYKHLALSWSGGKDSTVLLYLVKCYKPDITIFFGDTSVLFKETYEFRDRLVKEWNLNLINLKPYVSYSSVKGNREICCHNLKTIPLLVAIQKFKIGALFVGIRRNEHPSRFKESYFSPRNNPEHYRIHPLLHWKEKDIWDLIDKYKLPYNPLYDKGYRSIGCEPCTYQVLDKSASERSGRAYDKEKIMSRLRELGYY